VPIRTNPRMRPSRLFDSIWGYIKTSTATIVRIYAMYEPLKVFTYIGLTLFGAGFLLGLRLVYYYFQFEAGRHIPSAIAAALLMILGFMVLVIGLLADLNAGNRKLLEDVLYRVRSLELSSTVRRDESERLTHSAPNDRWER
jgi:hypothetical protein